MTGTLKKKSTFELKRKELTQGWDFVQFSKSYHHFVKCINSNYSVSIKILHLTAKLVKDPKNAKHNEGKRLSLIFSKIHQEVRQAI